MQQEGEEQSHNSGVRILDAESESLQEGMERDGHCEGETL